LCNKTGRIFLSKPGLVLPSAAAPYELAFEAKSVLRPTGGWQRMNAEFEALVCGNLRILNLMERSAQMSRIHATFAKWDELGIVKRSVAEP
jgi:hypothetical protein